MTSWIFARTSDLSLSGNSLCRLGRGQRGNVVDLALDVSCRLPEIDCPLSIQPELRAVAE